MAGWHTRLWRRVRVAPGVTINLSKSGPSVSVGPRGSKVTFGRRGVRQTVGIPGTGMYATRQLPRTGSRGRAVPAQPPAQPPAPAQEVADVGVGRGASVAAAADDQVELYYGLATVVGVVFGLVLIAVGVPAGEATLAAAPAIAGGIAYEGLAHHHPGPAKVLAQVVVGLATLVTLVLGAIAIGVIAGTLLGAGSSGRRRRR
jgi:Protein of unknown function (DUF4236)